MIIFLDLEAFYHSLCCMKFIFRFEIGDAYLGAISRFMTNAFEYGDALLAGQDSPDKSNAEVSNNQPYLNLAT